MPHGSPDQRGVAALPRQQEKHTAVMDLKHLVVRAARYGTSCTSKVSTLQFQLPNVASGYDRGHSMVDCLFFLACAVSIYERPLTIYPLLSQFSVPSI